MRNTHHLFAFDELNAAFYLVVRDEEHSAVLAHAALSTQTALLGSTAGPNLNDDTSMLLILLAFVSDDCAARVGTIWGKSPAEMLEWRTEFQEATGHPSTWDVEIGSDSE